MRIIFMGTPEFSVPTLETLIETGQEVVAVYTQPPRRAGRGKKERPSPVHECAQKHAIDVHTPLSLHKLEPRKVFEALKADVAVVVAYGLILPPKILAAPQHGCLNLHGSLLPRWRGAAPMQRALMAGDKRTGIQVMRMGKGLDTGPVCLSSMIEINANMTAGELHDDLMIRGADLMVKALHELANGTLSCEEQPSEGITYAQKLEKSETRIDWSRPARDVHNHIRGLSPFPGAWFEIEVNGKSERIKVLETDICEENGACGAVLDEYLRVGCATGAIRLLQLQRAGKRPMKADDFLRGLKIKAGQTLA